MADLLLGCCVSDEEKAQKHRSKTIDKQLGTGENALQENCENITAWFR